MKFTGNFGFRGIPKLVHRNFERLIITYGVPSGLLITLVPVIDVGRANEFSAVNFLF